MINEARKILSRLKSDRGIFYVAIGNLTSSILGAVFWLILASLLTVNDYGQINYYVASMSIASSIGLLGIHTVITTFLSKGDPHIRNQSIGIVLISNTAISLVLLTLFQFGLVTLMFIGITFFTLSISEILGLRGYKEYAITLSGQRAAQLVVGIGFYYIFGIQGLILGYALSSLIFGYKFLLSLRNLEFRFEDIKTKSSFIIHAFSTDIARNLTAFSDKLIIAPLFGFAILGYYQIGAQFLQFLGVIPSILYYYILPEHARGADRNNLFRVGLVVASLISAIFFISAPHIIDGIFPSFHDSILATQIMIVGTVPLTISLTINARMLASEKSKYVLFAALIYTSSQFILIYILGSIFGVTGLAFSTLIALIAEAVYLLIASKRMQSTFNTGTTPPK